MNSRRLSTSGLPFKDKERLDVEVLRLLNGPSNYEKRGDRIWIISQNKFLNEGTRKEVQLIDNQGNIIETFNSLSDCSKFLGIAKSTASERLKKNKSFFLFENNLVSLKWAEVPSTDSFLD